MGLWLWSLEVGARAGRDALKLGDRPPHEHKNNAKQDVSLRQYVLLEGRILTAKSLPRISYALTRRAALRLGLAGLVLPRLFTSTAWAAAQETETHGLSIFSDLALPAGFSHFPYVNAAAPKGGEIALQASATFGTQNFRTACARLSPMNTAMSDSTPICGIWSLRARTC